MITLNLETTNKQEEIVKEYLEKNVSEVLAEKINNGVKLVKDNKSLINKKTLSGFMKFACEEARKQAEKGANSACIEDTVVFGWAIHYFEEETIEEKLFNEDGTEYKVEVKTTPKTTTAPKIENKPKNETKQASLFDFMNVNNESYKSELSTKSQPDPLEIEDNEDEEMEECYEEENIVEEEIKEVEFEHKLQPNQKIDYDTGEIITIDNPTFDKYLLKTISAIFEGKVKLK